MRRREGLPRASRRASRRVEVRALLSMLSLLSLLLYEAVLPKPREDDLLDEMKELQARGHVQKLACVETWRRKRRTQEEEREERALLRQFFSRSTASLDLELHMTI